MKTLSQNASAKLSFNKHYTVLSILEAMCASDVKNGIQRDWSFIERMENFLTGLAFDFILEEEITELFLDMFLKIKSENIHTGGHLNTAFTEKEVSEMDNSLKCMKIIKKHNKKSSIFKELKKSVKQGVKIAKGEV